MKGIEPRALAIAAAAATFAIFAGCAILVETYPALAETAYGLIMHLDMTGQLEPVTAGTWLVGVLLPTAAAAFGAWVFAFTYNRFLPD